MFSHPLFLVQHRNVQKLLPKIFKFGTSKQPGFQRNAGDRHAVMGTSLGCEP